MSVLARWRALDPARRRLLLRALAELCAAGFKVRVMLFQRIAAGLGPMQPARMAEEDWVPSTADLERARAIRWAIAAAARRLPFETACLARALAAHALCREEGLAPILHMGAERGQQGRAETHAWLTAAGIPITGYPLPAGMVAVGCFVG